jgi:signal transduction histidine kinase
LGSRADVLEALTRIAEVLPAARGRSLIFERIGENVRTEVATRRERDPSALLGYVGYDESSVLDAIAAGADEAAVLPRIDAAQLIAFIDRTELRGRTRVGTARLQAALVHSEKLTALGTLVAGVGHEINNPLSSVLLSLFVLRHKLVPAVDAAREVMHAVARGAAPSPELLVKLEGLRGERDVPTLLDDVSTAANAIASVVRDLRAFAREDEREQSEAVQVTELIDRVSRLLGRDIAAHGVLERDYAPDIPLIVAPRNRLAQVITNLLSNASHAIAELQRPAHAIRVSVRTDEDHLVIAIADTGPGITPDAIERIFDPFFTTKRKGLGTGLGLTISRSILRDLGGDLSVESVYGEGATFLCVLPIPGELALREAQRRSEQAGPLELPRLVTVLVVDSDPQVLRSYARVLGAEHRLLVAPDENDAIELLSAGSTPDVLVVDLDLAGQGGVTLLAWLASHQPELLRSTVAVTSLHAEESHAALLRAHRGPLLYKPLRGEAVLAAIAKASG